MSDEISIKAVNDLIRRQQQSIIKAAATVSLACTFSSDRTGRKIGSKTIKRDRKHLNQINKEIGDSIFRRSYRMYPNSFWKLHSLIFDNDFPKKRKSGATPNGPILNSQRLSMALRWMAGGCKYDIGPHHSFTGRTDHT